MLFLIDITDPRDAMPWLVLLRSHITTGFTAARAGLARKLKAAESRQEIDRCERNALRLITEAEESLPPGTVPRSWDLSDPDIDPPSTKP